MLAAERDTAVDQDGIDEAAVAFVDRRSGLLCLEPVTAEGPMRWLYGPGRFSRLARRCLRRRLFSRALGWYHSRPRSTRALKRFVASAHIDLADAQNPLAHYRSVNDLFARRLSAGARPLVDDESVLVSPADARVLVYPALAGTQLVVKGGSYTLDDLVCDPELAQRFTGGTVAVLRLAPCDYHRFHFPAAGIASSARRIPGLYDSVNPIALAADPRVFCHNERQVTVLETERFGPILIVEVGAMFVGAIEQTYEPGRVERGAEKGFFRFGGSTVVVAFAANHTELAADLVAHSARGLETLVRMGSELARASD